MFSWSISQGGLVSLYPDDRYYMLPSNGFEKQTNKKTLYKTAHDKVYGASWISGSSVVTFQMCILDPSQEMTNTCIDDIFKTYTQITGWGENP